jgi:2-dehydro-3-deoxy-D-arabinonate dehydratase
MKYFRIEKNNKVNLIVNYKDDLAFNMTNFSSNIDNIEILYAEAKSTNLNRIKFVEKFMNDYLIEKEYLTNLLTGSNLLSPFMPEEVWAAGVTYKNSEFERKRESITPDIYSKVYNAKRPEIFFKSTGNRLVSPNQNIGIRSDSNWNVPESELAVVLISGEIIGFSIGNDMTSREIEGENPLYLTQAKIYNKSCSIGPCVIDSEAIKNINNLEIYCKITRNNKIVFSGSSKISDMNKTIPYLLEWLQKSNSLPLKSVLLTGTGIVPPPEFTLIPCDTVNISITEIGTLTNTIIKV